MDQQNKKTQGNPAFVSDLMKTFANYPATKEDFDQAVRRRHELYHDLGLEPEPFTERNPHPPCDTCQGTVYLAPGGMPSSEGKTSTCRKTATRWDEVLEALALGI